MPKSIKRSKALLICQVQTSGRRRHAVACGADILVAQGAEAGGHGIARSTFPFVPAVADTVRDIPVVAAGGVARRPRGLAAALMLGADGVLVGTRFYANLRRRLVHPVPKNRIVAASGDAHDPQHSIRHRTAQRVGLRPIPGVCSANEFSERWRGREPEPPSTRRPRPPATISRSRGRRLRHRGRDCR